ncbi:SDR family oxidoreductase [Methylomonas koyamae]|uniref:Oxidoreductase n=1 Tax=Methylomonas koyamae TaxID=702114 RepID=A0A291IJM3_9GAMM|nr:SDR family oxidoreductase [Methylomonas koyamae]ATG90396.1 oxidoreductase [Methylomonas koyamae]OAI24614.1 oxidoreductase [Methylomonas koyamae]
MVEARTIFITGATRGLGRAMAEKFAVLGHRVIGCGRSAGAIAELAAACGSNHRFDTVDVAEDAAVAAWARAAIAEFGAPDLLLNNAAVINPVQPLWQIPAADFDVLVDINIKGVANVIRQFLPAMLERQRGVCVNFSSGWGRSVAAGVAPYCASKWAIEGLTKALAAELPATMAAVALNPGIIDTDMLQACFGAAAAHYPTAESWAEAAVPFLLKLGAADNGKSLTVPGH